MKRVNLSSLSSSPLFLGLSQEDMRELEARFHARDIDEGMTVFVENMPGESLYLIQSGVVKISKMLSEGEERILVILGPDDVFGEMALLDGAARSATARVAESATLLALKRQDFEELCDHNPRLGLQLIRNISRVFSQRVRNNNDEYRDMMLWALGKKGKP